MEDSDSGVASMSSGHGTSLGGDDRSGAGSRSSAASISEVSSPAPPMQQQHAQNYTLAQQQQPLALTVPRSSSAEPVRVWRDPLLLESGPVVRHIHSLQHHALMMAPGEVANNLATTESTAAASHLPLLLPPPLYGPTDIWPGGVSAGHHQQQQQQHYEEEKTTNVYRDRTTPTTGRVLRDMERGKDVDRERMVHHIQRERERDADREAEQAVDKHFEESLKKYKHSQHNQMPWSINTIPVQHSLSQAPGASPPPPPRSAAPQLGAGISPSLSISSVPATNSSAGLASLNISPTTNNNNNSNTKKGFVKTTSSGNISKSSDSGHVSDHHARGPTTTTDVIGLISRNGGAGAGSAGMIGNMHYDNYLPPSQMLAVAEEQRRVRIERDRIMMADREREQQQQQHQQQIEGDQLRRHREREKEIERMRHLEQQQRASYYATAGAIHRSPSSTTGSGSGSTNGNNKSSISVIPTNSPINSAHNNNGSNSSGVSIDYAHHRGLTISPSMKQQQHMDSGSKQQAPPPHGHLLYPYHPNLYQPIGQYHKDIKGKSEMSLPAPPPLLSDVKSGGVIVKHDTSGPLKSQQMSSSLQVIPTSSLGNNTSSSSSSNNNNKSSSHSPNQYKSAAHPPMSQAQLLFEYRNPTIGSGPPNIVSIHAAPRDASPHSSHPHQQQQQHQYQHQQQMIHGDRFNKMQSYQPVQQRQSPAANVVAGGYQRQAPSPKQLLSSDSGYGSSVSQSGKPKVSSPAPAHIYGKPESGTIGSSNVGSAGIMTGIPVCRAGGTYQAAQSMHIVSKPSITGSSSSAISIESQQRSGQYSSQRIYGTPAPSGPPPAHSRVFEAPTTWPYAGPAPPSTAPSHSSLLHSASPVSITVNPSMIRSSSGPAALQIPGSHVTTGHSISISTSSVVMPPHIVVPDVQTQPLDLGTSDRSRDSMHSNNSSESKSPPAMAMLKRKSNTPIHYQQSPVAVNEMKKKRIEQLPQPHGSYQQAQHPAINHQYSGGPQHPHYSVYQSLPGSVAIHPIPEGYLVQHGAGGRKEMPKHPISVVVSLANANDNSQSALKQPLPHPHSISVLPEGNSAGRDVLVTKGPPQPMAMQSNAIVNHSVTIIKAEEQQHVPSSQSTSITPIVGNSKPTATMTINTSPTTTTTTTTSTPIKLPIAEPAPTTTVSPVAKAVSHGGPRNLKKAWLQRHTGEDTEDKTISAVGAPVQEAPELVKTNGLNRVNGLSGEVIVSATATVQSSPVKSISAVGSMAVNSVVKSAIADGGNNGSKLSVQHPKKGSGQPQQMNNSLAKPKRQIYTDSEDEDVSSSDQEHAIKTPPKKKQAKTKRKKGGGRKPLAAKKRGSSAASQAAAASADSDKNSDREKETASDKDSDSGTSTSHGKHTPGSRASNGSFGKSSPGPGVAKLDVKERRKRGRRPKITKEDPLKKKQSKQDHANATAQADEKSVANELKKSGKTFLQENACHEMSERLGKCRECRLPPDQRTTFCRFYAFRRLRYNKNGQMAVAGFSDPKKDPDETDVRLWSPNRDEPPTNLNMDTCNFILSNIARQFCTLLSTEINALNENPTRKQAWKKVVNGMREMCDVCETTLFNLHWSCNKCGFAVCMDCSKSRRQGCVKLWSDSDKDCDDYRWLLCTNGSSHDPERLTATQIVAGNTLAPMDRELHDLCNVFGIDIKCQCAPAKTVSAEFLEMAGRVVAKAQQQGIKSAKPPRNEEENSLSVLADVALQQNEKGNKNGVKLEPMGSSSDDEREVENYDYVVLNACRKALARFKASSDGLLDVKLEGDGVKVKLENVQPRSPSPPIRHLNVTETKLLYPDTPHSWLCDGKLLRLHDPTNENNYKMFLEQWKRGQPVLVSDVAKKLRKELWTPESFTADFGDRKHDLVNCINGDVISNLPMKKFWDGFDTSRRLKDDKGQPMLLKLKDWPPDENFATMLPERFEDLMAALPLPEYTHRNGSLNLAGRLPGCFVRPDLGPKMYNAYGSALHPTKGTTNLHMDISDAVNVMVYVGIPKGVHTEETKEAFRAIDEAGCDILTRRRVRDKGELPGALWHIYAPNDADKIRKLLREVALERGEQNEDDSDPIHDQSWYLDGPLRERLYKSYGVEGYPIAQCLGDAIFIPAGAPHQVRNLHNCIKVAEDFVSPENISNCIKLTHEFRQLSDSHQNHEDKLQIKNIMYHAAKECLAYLYGRLVKAAEWQGNGRQ